MEIVIKDKYEGLCSRYGKRVNVKKIVTSIKWCGWWP